jgi:hypothetical protein
LGKEAEMKTVKLTFTALMLLSIWTSSQAQVTNVEGRRLKMDTLGWYRELNTGLRFVKEVSNVYTLHNDARIQYKNEKNLYLGLLEYNWSGGGGNTLNHNAFLHLRYNRAMPREDIKWEAFTQIQFNEITRINARWLLGTGPRFKIVGKEDYVFYLGTLYMFEILREKDLDNNPIRQVDHRSSTYLSFSVFPKDNMSIISTTYYQPRLDDILDYRLNNVTEFRVKVGKLLTMGISYRLTLDTDPAPGIPKLNHFLDNRIGIVF